MPVSRPFGVFALVAFLAFLSGCLKNNGTGPAASDDSSFLIGTWAGIFDSADGDVDTNLFYANEAGIHMFSIYDKVNGKWVLDETDTAILSQYGVTHGMLHFVEKAKTGSMIPDIEYWQKYVLQGNNMTWYRGLLLHGGSPGVLAGNWQVDPSSVDANPQPYFYNFSNGVLYVSRSGVVSDSLTYTVVGSAIQRCSLKNGAKDTLQYEFDGDYMRLYNPSVTVSYTKVK